MTVIVIIIIITIIVIIIINIVIIIVVLLCDFINLDLKIYKTTIFKLENLN